MQQISRGHNALQNWLLGGQNKTKTARDHEILLTMGNGGAPALFQIDVSIRNFARAGGGGPVERGREVLYYTLGLARSPYPPSLEFA
jgi:hypothetical protein